MTKFDKIIKLKINLEKKIKINSFGSKWEFTVAYLTEIDSRENNYLIYPSNPF